MGLIASIYRDSAADFSDGGVSSGYQRVCIVNIDGPFQPTANAYPVMLVPGNLPGTVKIVEAVDSYDLGVEWEAKRISNRVGPMMGGTFIHTSDARFGRAVADLIGGSPYGVGPVAFHDRWETPEQYDLLSR